MPAGIKSPLVHTINGTLERIGRCIGRTRLYEEINTGELETITIGDRRLITEEAIVRWLARKEEQARQQKPDLEPAATPEPAEQPARKRQPRKRLEPAGAE